MSTVPAPAALPLPTRRQAQAAYRLARAFGHAWANSYEDDGTATPAERAIAREMAGEVHPHDPDWPGIQGVEVNKYGVISHTSGSGSIRWKIQRDGYVEVFITVTSEPYGWSPLATEVARVWGFPGDGELTMQALAMARGRQLACEGGDWRWEDAEGADIGERVETWNEAWPEKAMRSPHYVANVLRTAVEALGAAAAPRFLAAVAKMTPQEARWAQQAD